MTLSTSSLGSGIEKRKAKRANLDKPARIITNSNELNVRVVSISTNGIGLISLNNVLPNTVTEIKLSLYFYGELTELTLHANVIETTQVQNEYLLRLALLESSPFTLRVIDQFVFLHT